MARGLLDDPALSRSMLLPFGKRTYQDYDDDVSEYDRTEFALPSAIADPLGRGGLLAKQALTGQRMNPNDATQAMLDVGMLSTPVGLLGGVPKGAVLGANVFQGGPHKYGPEGAAESLKHMSKGEGAQAYGYGRYDAENPEVAKTYKPTTKQDVELSTADRIAELEKLSNDELGKLAYNEFGIELKGDDLTEAIDDWLIKDLADSEQFTFSLRDPVVDSSYIYKHDLPDEDIARYLDWDAPLSEQPEALAKARQHWDDTLGDPDIVMQRLGISDTSTGRELYQALGGVTQRQQAASEALGKAGIPGLKYFDGMSRNQTAQATIDGVPVDKYKPKNGYEEYLISKFNAGKPLHEIQKIADMRSEGVDLMKRWKVSVPEGTRNFVTWDQDVLNRMKLLERNGEKFDGLLGR